MIEKVGRNRVTFQFCAGFLLLAMACSSVSKPEDSKPSPSETWHQTLSRALSVRLAPGETALVVEGFLKQGEEASFVVSAHEGDLLLVHLLSEEPELELTVHAASDGTIMEGNQTNHGTFWSGGIPATGGYLVRAQSKIEGTAFSLEIEIPRRLTVTQEQSKIEIKTSASPHSPVAYVLPLNEGQLLGLQLASAEGGVQLSVHGLQDGEQLVTWESAQASFKGKIKVSQDYLIHIAPEGGPSELTLDISIGTEG